MLIISLLSLSLVRFSVSFIFENIATKSHFFCIQNLPKNSNSIAELKALVCAENFTNLNQSKLYISSGLIHLFVVSGSHLILLENILLRISLKNPLQKYFIFFVLTAYALMCNLNAPVTRCLIAFSLNHYLGSKNIRWPPHLKLLVIGLMSLFFNYTWINSMSLQMSWIAAFLVALGESFFTERTAVFKQSLFFLALFPSIVFFQVPKPIIILINLVFAPLLEFILFPLGLLVWFFNFLEPLFDLLINLLKTSLQKLEFDFQFQTADFPERLLIFNWALIFTLHFVFHVIYVHQKRTANI